MRTHLDGRDLAGSTCRLPGDLHAYIGIFIEHGHYVLVSGLHIHRQATDSKHTWITDTTHTTLDKSCEWHRKHTCAPCRAVNCQCVKSQWLACQDPCRSLMCIAHCSGYHQPEGRWRVKTEAGRGRAWCLDPTENPHDTEPHRPPEESGYPFLLYGAMTAGDRFQQRGSIVCRYAMEILEKGKAGPKHGPSISQDWQPTLKYLTCLYPVCKTKPTYF